MLEVLGLVAATGLLSAAWTTLWTWISDGSKRKASAISLALRTSVALEAYAIDCWHIGYAQTETFRQTGQPFADYVPTLILPADDWSLVDAGLVNEVLSFVNSISVVRAKAAYSRHLESNPFEAEMFAKQKGQEAYLIASRLREKYKLAAAPGLKDQIAALFEKDNTANA